MFAALRKYSCDRRVGQRDPEDDVQATVWSARHQHGGQQKEAQVHGTRTEMAIH